ncbi:MAG: hypothetical protein IPJ17_03620 [Holophagales bacterium]|jgi:hypothetical protein|nr:MAG: hypothetical protein IPJ17_03620 [Holophagales bacterium]
MSRRDELPRAPVKRAFVAAFLLHTLALAWIWTRYGQGARGGLVVWMDLPWSLAYLGKSGRTLLTWSSLVGGAWWGFLGALFARLLGRLAHRTRATGR